jgi:lipopolysaccharide/colanic/teichoic acid biosynthesis glycosyltransferase
MNDSFKVLQVAAVDETVKFFLLPLIDRLLLEGYQVHITCSMGRYVPELQNQGYVVHPITIERRINPVSNLRSLWHLYHLMKRGQFDIVHVHTPIAAALGRIAAWAAQVPAVIYTAHGFYFHENMPRWMRRFIIWLEKLLCCVTDLVLTQSQEDAVTAVREAICSQDKVLWIGNGVDTARFTLDPDHDGARECLGLCAQDIVVGFVGRLVREKGVLELLEAMKLVFKAIPDAKLLVVGDTLSSDRDRKTKHAITRLVAQDGLASRVLFTGFVEDIPKVMAAIDLVVLPSQREGMPRSIIEAMASSKPVIATNIRGCREEVVHGLTGLLVPVGDSSALAQAIVSLLKNPELTHQMGVDGRRRACELFDERIVIDRQITAYAALAQKKLVHQAEQGRGTTKKRLQLWLKRAIDIGLSSLGLALLIIPFVVIAVLIKWDSSGPVFFHQERLGKHERPFRIWKFRTMVEGAINKGLGLISARDDPRNTRVGKLLRNWGLDEIPQMINVLKGEMSIVGPRPPLCYPVKEYDNFYRQRFLAKPGITSLAVVKGRNLVSWRDRIKLDVWYINNWSLWLDLRIILKTFWVVLVTHKGVYGEGGINDGGFVSNNIGRYSATEPKHTDEQASSVGDHEE